MFDVRCLMLSAGPRSRNFTLQDLEQQACTPIILLFMFYSQNPQELTQVTLERTF